MHLLWSELLVPEIEAFSLWDLNSGVYTNTIIILLTTTIIIINIIVIY